jgi:pantoate--beta-alanine ligase
MKESTRRLQDGDDVAAAMADGAEMVTAAGFALDYFEVRHAGTLERVASAKDGPMRILVAARLGNTRLIDNIRV